MQILRELFAIAFGSEAGRFQYPIANRPDTAMVVVGAVAVVLALAALRASLPRLQTHLRPILLLWLVLACGLHAAMTRLMYADYHAIITSDLANGFYTVAQKHTGGEILSRFHELAPSWPTHPRANMPGKLLLYKALQGVVTSPLQIGVLIVVLSNVLGGLLIFAVARQWFEDARTAFYAFVLYLFLPARIYFFPLLNTISPVLLLATWWLAIAATRGPRLWLSFAAGVSLFALLMFDPLTLAACPLVIPVIYEDIRRGRTSTATASVATAIGLSGFATIATAAHFTTGFNLFSGLGAVFADAQAFNARAIRPYSVWVFHNLKDFFLNAGVAQSIAFLWLAGWSWRLPRLERTLAGTFLALVIGLDLSGVNRGESVRLWIFLAVAMQILVARALAIWRQGERFAPVLAVSLIQTVVCLRIVAWIIPWNG